MYEQSNGTDDAIEYDEYTVVNATEEKEKLTIDMVEDPDQDCLGMVTEEGVIQGILTETEEQSEKTARYSSIASGMIKINNKWRKFKVNSYSNAIKLDQDFGKTVELEYIKDVTYTATFKVDQDIIIDKHDLTEFEGVGEKRNDFNNIRECLKHITANDGFRNYSKYSGTSIPVSVEAEISRHIKLVDEVETQEEEIRYEDIDL